ncbi:hypothetical protein HOA56_04080 [archaeon]|nr:hypothetical protein [archaeon]
MKHLFLIVALALFSTIVNGQLLEGKNEFGATPITPYFGFSSEDVFDIEFTTEEALVLCKYSNNNVDFDSIQNPNNFFETTDKHTHKLNDYDDMQGIYNQEKEIFVKCVNESDYVNEYYPIRIPLIIDNTPPIIEDFGADPEKVIENLEVKLFIDTDDFSRCRFDEKENRFDLMKNDFEYLSPDDYKKKNFRELTTTGEPNIADGNSYSFFVACQNVLGETTGTKEIKFDVDLSVENEILSISPIDEIYNYTDIFIDIKTNKNAECEINNIDQEIINYGNRKNHEFILSDLKEAIYSIDVLCRFDLGGPDKTATASFTIDQTPPSNVTIETETKICSDKNELDAKFNAQDNHQISHFKYSIFRDSTAVITNKTTKEKANEKINLISGKTYTWKTIAVDLAGNEGDETTSETINILSENETECIEYEDAIMYIYNKTLSSGDIQVTLSCIESDGSSCPTLEYAKYNDISGECNECFSCSSTSCKLCNYTSYFSPITFFEDGTICFKAVDKMDQPHVGSKHIGVSSNQCTKFPDGCCVDDFDGLCDTDCLGTIDPDCEEEIVEEKDTDLDKIPDEWEKKNGLNFTDPNDANHDYDNDTLTNLEEYNLIEIYDKSTDPYNNDTDDDGFSDDLEIKEKTNPTLFSSKPKINEEPEEKSEKKEETEEESEKEPKKDSTNPIILIIGGLIFVIIFIGIIVVLMKPKKKGNKKNKTKKNKKNIPISKNTNNSKMSFSQSQPMMPNQNINQKREQPKPIIKPENIEQKIIKRRKNVKKKERESIFNEFLVDIIYKKKIQKKEQKQKEEVKEEIKFKEKKKKIIKRQSPFEKIDKLNQSKNFRKLDTISEEKDEDKLDNIVKKNKKNTDNKLDRLIGGKK